MCLLFVQRGNNVGTDYYGYLYSYSHMTSMQYTDSYCYNMEPGFRFLMFSFHRLGVSARIFYLLLFCVFLFSILRFSRYKKANGAWAIFVLVFLDYYFMSFNIFRQIFAIGLLLFFIPLLERKKYLLFSIAVILIGYLFHSSIYLSLLLVIIHWIASKNTKINKPLLYIAITLSYAVFFIAKDYVYDYFSDALLIINMADRFGDYVEGGLYRKEIGIVSSTCYSVFSLFLIFCKSPNNHKFETYVVIFSYVLFNLFNMLDSQSTRIFLNFNIFILYLSYLIIQDKKTKFRFIFKLVFIIMAITLFSAHFIVGENEGVKPYYTHEINDVFR